MQLEQNYAAQVFQKCDGYLMGSKQDNPRDLNSLLNYVQSFNTKDDVKIGFYKNQMSAYDSYFRLPGSVNSFVGGCFNTDRYNALKSEIEEINGLDNKYKRGSVKALQASMRNRIVYFLNNHADPCP